MCLFNCCIFKTLHILFQCQTTVIRARTPDCCYVVLSPTAHIPTYRQPPLPIGAKCFTPAEQRIDEITKNFCRCSPALPNHISRTKMPLEALPPKHNLPFCSIFSGYYITIAKCSIKQHNPLC